MQEAHRWLRRRLHRHRLLMQLLPIALGTELPTGEVELRRQVVGRKSWLLCGSDEAAEWKTVVSPIASCELHGIAPWAYLRDVLTLLPNWKKSKALELAPKYWKATNTWEDSGLSSNETSSGVYRRRGWLGISASSAV